MSPRPLWQKLRAWWSSDERLRALESAANAAAERTAAVEASLLDSRLEWERNQSRAATALEAITAELRSELAGIASGLTALEKRVSSTDADRQRREVEQEAGRTRHEECVRRLEEQVGTLRANLDRIRVALEDFTTGVRSPEFWRESRAGLEQVRDAVTHQAEQLDLLKSSLEVDPTLIDEFQEWKAGHPLSDHPLVSVCVATYNRAQLLVERCLPSVLGQSYRHLELIVVGDGCTDDTAERVAAVRDPRLRFVNLPRRRDYPADSLRRWMVAGTAAVNNTLGRARGDLITHLDDDDEYLPERLEKLVAFIRAEACDLVWHPFWYEDHDGRWLLNDAGQFAFSRVTTSSVLYRSWFKKIQWDPDAHRLMEPGDWNRFRRLTYVGSVCRRFPEPLLRHYRERRPRPGPAASSAS